MSSDNNSVPSAATARRMAQEITHSAGSDSKLRGRAYLTMGAGIQIPPGIITPVPEVPVEVVPDPALAAIHIKDGMLVVDFRSTSYANRYENVRITETSKGVVVEAEKQIWKQNGWAWANFFTDWDEAIYLPRDLHLLHPSMLPLMRSKTKTVGWLWNQRYEYEHYVDSDLIRVNNRPEQFKSSNYTIIR